MEAKVYKRILNELFGLNKKILKLYTFMDSEEFQSIKESQQDLLRIQFDAMHTYARCLEARISDIKKTKQ